MLIEHLNKIPQIHKTAYVAPNAVICGDVTIGKNTRIMFGAQIIAESHPIVIGDNCIVLQNAVIRAANAASVRIGNNCLVGPNSHLASCEIEDNVFIATGASIFHGSTIKQGAEIRINGLVHLKTTFPENEVLPIGWVAVGNPMQMFPASEHEKIWSIQKALNFPNFVYDIKDRASLDNTNRVLCSTMSKRLGSHLEDRIIDEF